MLSNQVPTFLKSVFSFVTSKQHTSPGEKRGCTMAGLAPGPRPTRMTMPGTPDRTRRKTVSRIGCQSLYQILTCDRLPVHSRILWDGGKVVFWKTNGKQKQQESNNPGLFLVWFQGGWISGSKGSCSHNGCGISLPSLLPPGVGGWGKAGQASDCL